MNTKGRTYGRIPLTRPAATLSPSEGERDGVRGIHMDLRLSAVKEHNGR
jgi:hypothetical protein